MDERTLTALKGSIEKWEGIVAGTEEDKGVINCPLCRAFREPSCNGCPVKEKTGMVGCRGTPYYEWEELCIKRTVTDEHRAVAQKELDFLKSLLPSPYIIGDCPDGISYSDGGTSDQPTGEPLKLDVDAFLKDVRPEVEFDPEFFILGGPQPQSYEYHITHEDMGMSRALFEREWLIAGLWAMVKAYRENGVPSHEQPDAVRQALAALLFAGEEIG